EERRKQADDAERIRRGPNRDHDGPPRVTGLIQPNNARNSNCKLMQLAPGGRQPSIRAETRSRDASEPGRLAIVAEDLDEGRDDLALGASRTRAVDQKLHEVRIASSCVGQ